MHPRQSFSSALVPVAPDYSQDRYWAALPWAKDAADLTPDGLNNNQNKAEIDVFFLHPTTYTGKRGEKLWNGPVRDDQLNKRTSDGTIQFQASIFNETGRVFAPYYRQAHLHAYHTKDSLSAQRAFDIAYDDIRMAFRYYLANHNHDKPFIIAAHSQGTTHAIRLLQEFIDGQPLQEKMIAAYIVGIPVFNHSFKQIQACSTATETGCFTAWRTYKKGFKPKENDLNKDVVVTNPLSWTTDNLLVPKEKNLGAVLNPFEIITPQASDAQVAGPILWVSKPKFRGSLFLMGSNYHIGDMNIFYMNIRENTKTRTNAYFDKQ